MSNILEKIKSLIPKLENDGSIELAQQYEEMIKHEGLMRELKQNEGFKRILDIMKQDFKEKLLKTVEGDPELREMRKMFIRVLGAEGASKSIEESINELISTEEEAL